MGDEPNEAELNGYEKLIRAEALQQERALNYKPPPKRSEPQNLDLVNFSDLQKPAAPIHYGPPLSLRDLCDEMLLNLPVETVNILAVYQVADMCSAERLKKKYLNKIALAFPGMLEMAGEESVREALGDEKFEGLMEEHRELQKKVSMIKLRGSVVEVEAAPLDIVRVSSTGSGKNCYPYSSLKSGIAWYSISPYDLILPPHLIPPLPRSKPADVDADRE